MNIEHATRDNSTEKSQILIAAIDVGATAARMRIVQARKSGKYQIVENLVHPLNLGNDTFRVGHVTPTSMRAAFQVLKNFSNIMAEYGIVESVAVATSALREASNKDIVIDRIRHESGITLRVLDAVEESRLTYQTILPFMRKNLSSKRKHTLLIDLGGGSTEIMVLKGLDLALVSSRRLGASRLFYTVTDADFGDSQSLLESVIRNVITSTELLYQSYPIEECVMINGLMCRVFSGENGSRDIQNGVLASSSTIYKVFSDYEKLTPVQQAKRFKISAADTELLNPTMMILKEFIDSVKVKRVFFAELDMLDGLICEMINKLRGDVPQGSFAKQIVRSALSIAQRYDCANKHGEQVERLSCKLFDGLSDFLDLAAIDRLILRVAAILHDAGMYISERAHHKHGAYLTRWSEIMGLAEENREIVAQIIRYHRKATPQTNHVEFMSLSSQKRLRISKLASLLRIADALDRRHESIIRDIEVKVDESNLILTAQCSCDLSVEKAAMVSKGDLFEQMTGMKIVLSRKD